LENSLPQDLVIVEDKVPYCDTRVAANKLGIKHGPFMTNTIMKYQEQVEAKCGLVHFKNEAVKTEGGRGIKYQRYALLTEVQTNAYLGLVRNTDQSVELKIDLAVAFDQAKKIIDQLLNEQSETVIRQHTVLDPIETAQNPQLLRQAVEQLEDIALAAAKKAQLFKLLEQHYYPSQYRPRGKRNLPQAKPVIWNRLQVTQMTIIFEIA
jgi:hypothetical protein